jgi:GT2 family glycosyltransferase
VQVAQTALIATVYQEGRNIRAWLEALATQSAFPEEFVIVDGGSTDDTVAQIESYAWPAGFPKPRVVVQRCNIAEGRNLAIRHTLQPIIVSTDAGSAPQPEWLEKIVAPLIQHPGISVVGGQSTTILRNAFQQSVAQYEVSPPATSETVMPSSRCIAFRRDAWSAVGGYPEWLTLTGEDALFNHNLRAAGLLFYYEPRAVVAWEIRPALRS